jgi:hypothetical protein
MDRRPDLIKIRALLGMCEQQMRAGLELIEIYAAWELEKAAALVAILRQVASDPRVLYTADRIYTELSDGEVRKLAATAPGSGQTYMVMAHELILERDLDRAIANLRKALATDPHLPGIHCELAEALNSSPEMRLKSQVDREKGGFRFLSILSLRKAH